MSIFKNVSGKRVTETAAETTDSMLIRPSCFNNSTRLIYVDPKVSVSEELTQTSSSIFDLISYLSGSSTQMSVDDDEVTRSNEHLNVILPENSRSPPGSAQSTTRSILSSFTSAHIRQFVSPFYKPPALIPSNRSPTKNATSRNSGTRNSARRNSASRDTRGSSQLSRKSVRLSLTGSQAQTKKQEKKKQTSKLRVISDDSELSLNQKKRKLSKKMEKNVVERLTTPTQSMLLRNLVFPLDDNKKKSAMDYTKRIFLCQKCKKRNEDI